MANIEFLNPDHTAGAPEDHDDERGWPDLACTPIFARDVLLSHFLNSLVAKVELLSQLVPKGNTHRKMLCKVRSGIAKFRDEKHLQTHERINHAWTNAFRLELLLALAEPSERLIPELEARLGQADEEKVSCAVVGRLRGILQQMTLPQSAQTQIPADPGEKDCRLRSMLIDIIQTIQWQLTKKYEFRYLQRRATGKIIIAALLSFLIFLSPYITIFALYKYADDNMKYVKDWIGLPLVTSLSAGLFGAYFSRLLYIQKNWNLLSYDDLKSAGNVWSIFLRGMIGVCGAAIIFFFLHAEIISGNLVPNFSLMVMALNDHDGRLPATLFIGRNLGLLVVWSFIAGFSERLVPNILARTEMRLDGTSKPPNSVGQ